MNKRQRFITASQWLWGISKRSALSYYRDWSKHNPNIIDNVIEIFESNAKRSFSED